MNRFPLQEISSTRPRQTSGCHDRGWDGHWFVCVFRVFLCAVFVPAGPVCHSSHFRHFFFCLLLFWSLFSKESSWMVERQFFCELQQTTRLDRSHRQDHEDKPLYYAQGGEPCLTLPSSLALTSQLVTKSECRTWIGSKDFPKIFGLSKLWARSISSNSFP